jgi:general secretion pathway protein M
MSRVRGNLARSLPEGRNGRLLALALTAIALLLVWDLVLLPLVDWYGTRAARLADADALLRRERLLAERLPALRDAARRLADAKAPAALMEQSSDVLAAAALQERVQQMAGSLGLNLASTESLPATDAGSYRRIGVRVSLSARYPAMVKLFAAIEQAQPVMLLDDLQLHGARLSPQPDSPLEAAFTVLAFRLAGPAAERHAAPQPAAPDDADASNGGAP